MQVRAIQTPPPRVEGTQQYERRETADVTTTKPAPAGQQAAAGKHPLLTVEEQRYFETLFPETGNEQRSTSAYTVAGAQKHSVPGTLVDRKA